MAAVKCAGAAVGCGCAVAKRDCYRHQPAPVPLLPTDLTAAMLYIADEAAVAALGPR